MWNRREFGVRLAGLVCAAVALTLAALAFAAPAWAAHTAYVTNHGSNDVSADSIAADGSLSALTGSPFAAGTSPAQVAVTPDGGHLYVANETSDNVSAYSIAADGSLSRLTASPFAAGTAPTGLAVSPDGGHLYVANQNSNNVSAYSIAADGSLSPVPGSPFGAGTSPYGVAVSADGAHLYVTNPVSNDVSAYSIAADGSLNPVTGSPFAAGTDPVGVAVTPDGAHLYITNASSNSVSAYSIAADGSLAPVAGSPFGAGTGPIWVAVAPNGAHLYVANNGSNSVSAYSVAADGSLTAVLGSPFASGTHPEDLAVSPDGANLYVPNVSSNDVSAYSIAADGSLGALAGSPFAAGTTPVALAMRPDQGPVAAFAATPVPPGSASSFDASASSDPDGTVASYHWDFGDGQTQTTQGPTTTHTYSNPGTYTATLTVTDDAGCSTTKTFTGQTMSCNGSPAAQIAHQLMITNGQPPVTRTLTVSKLGTGSGSVTSSPAGIDCGSTCSAQFNDGAHVTLTGASVSGSTFTGWSGGGCSGTGTCAVTMSADQSVTATFQAPVPVQHTLTVTKSGSGSGAITSSPAGVDCGSTCSAPFNDGAQVTLTATPISGSTFAGWSGGGCSGTGTCQITLGQDAAVTADFSPSGSGSTPQGAGCSPAAAADRAGAVARVAATAPPVDTIQFWTMETGGVTSGGITRITGLMQPQTDYRYGDSARRKRVNPRAQDFAPITLTVLPCSAADVALSSWLQQIVDDHALREDVTLTALDADSNPVVQYVVRTAFITNVAICPMQANAQQQVCLKSYTISYASLTIQQLFPSTPVTTSSTATVTAGRSVLTLACKSNTPCLGIAKLAVFGGLAHGASVKAPKVLGHTRFKINPHHKAKLRIHLNAYGLRRLRLSRGHRLATALIIHPAGTPSWHTITRRIELVGNGN